MAKLTEPLEANSTAHGWPASLKTIDEVAFWRVLMILRRFESPKTSADINTVKGLTLLAQEDGKTWQMALTSENHLQGVGIQESGHVANVT